MATYLPPKINTAYIIYVSLVSQANTNVMQANPTIAAGDFKVRTDGAALANLATLPSVDPAGSVWVKISLSAAEMNGANCGVQCIDAAGAEWCDFTFNIQTSARQVDDLAYPATSGRSMVVDAAGLVDANLVASQIFIKKNVALANFEFVMTDSTNHAPMAGLAVTATRNIDNAGFGACANAVAGVANGWYAINLAAADVNGTVIAFRFTAAGADDLNFTVITQP